LERQSIDSIERSTATEALGESTDHAIGSHLSDYSTRSTNEEVSCGIKSYSYRVLRVLLGIGGELGDYVLKIRE
jgi:hypothetical protein